MPGIKEALTMDFKERIRVTRESILKGKRHYSTPDRVPYNEEKHGTNIRTVLGTGGTLPWYKR